MSRPHTIGEIFILIAATGGMLCLFCSRAWAMSADSLSYMMPNVTLEGNRIRHTKGDEEATRLIRLIAQEHATQQKQLQSDYSYRQVDKLSLNLANFDLKSRFINLLFPSFKKYVKHSALDGRWVLPLSQREVVSDFGVRGATRKRTEVIRYRNHIGLDQNIDDGTMTVGLEELFPHIDLYASHIKMLDAQFAGPLSPTGPEHYKYYLTDTIISRGRVVQVISFYPYHPTAFTLCGDLYITRDAHPHLMRSVITVPHSTNLNFIDALRIVQEYDEICPSIWMISREKMAAAFRLHWNLLSLYVNQERSFGSYDFSPSDSLLFPPTPRVIDHSNIPDEVHATDAQQRQAKLLVTDRGLKQFLEELKMLPTYKFAFDLVDMIAINYLRTSYNPHKLYGGSLFDIGPITSVWGQNGIEGIRLRLGGRTTSFFSRRLFFEGYVAYGLTDQRLKYSITGAYSFGDKRYFREEFPRHEIAITHTSDLFTPGQIFVNNDKDNLLYNLGTSYMASRSYRKLWSMEYQVEPVPGFSARVYAQHLTDTPAGDLSYIRVQRDSSLYRINSITDASLGIALRWAPGERIREGSMQRHSAFRNQVQREVPVFTLRHESALPELGGHFRRNRTELQLDHRLWMGNAGRLDYQITFGKLWDNVPFPMLYTPPVNVAFFLNDNAFQLLYPYEFLSDEWSTIFAQWHMRGMIFNRIPLVNRLGLRGVLSANFLYGNTTQKNLQAYSQELFVLPTNATEMIRKSYLELGFGIENIFRILRLDVFYRVSSPGPHSRPSPWVVRARIGLSF